MFDRILNNLRCLFLPCGENCYKPKLLDAKFLYYYAALLLVLKLVVVPFFLYLPNTAFFADLTKTSLIELANIERESLGINTLEENPVLNQAAYLKAKDMMDNDYFSHESPQGVTPWQWFLQAGYDYKFAGENLAIGFIESGEVNQAWMNSPAHKQNIINPSFREIGIAVLTGDFQGKETTVVVQLFGTMQPQVAQAINQQVNITENVQEEIVMEQSGTTEPQFLVIQTENATQSATSQIASTEDGGQKKEVLAAYSAAEDRSGFMFRFASFLASGYYNLLQKIIYGSLALIAFLLINTVLFDMFVYRSYHIDHRGILLKAMIFFLILAALLVVDKETVSLIFPHNLLIV